jgi:hypothetical protein
VGYAKLHITRLETRIGLLHCTSYRSFVDTDYQFAFTVTFLTSQMRTRVRVVPGSNLFWETGYPDRSFSFFSSPQEHIGGPDMGDAPDERGRNQMIIRLSKFRFSYSVLAGASCRLLTQPEARYTARQATRPQSKLTPPRSRRLEK